MHINNLNLQLCQLGKRINSTACRQYIGIKHMACCQISLIGYQQDCSSQQLMHNRGQQILLLQVHNRKTKHLLHVQLIIVEDTELTQHSTKVNTHPNKSLCAMRRSNFCHWLYYFAADSSRYCREYFQSHAIFPYQSHIYFSFSTIMRSDAASDHRFIFRNIQLCCCKLTPELKNVISKLST